MIVGIPDPEQLKEIAVGWINLAWEITIKEVKEFQDAEHFYLFEWGDEEEKKDEAALQRAADKFWKAAQLKLNNAISLLQQSLEIFLKARIAAVSPFLLIAGEPQTWPKPKEGDTHFSTLRTIDAVNLYVANNRIASVKLPEKFKEFYDRLRRERNIISHLAPSEIEEGAASILDDILTAFTYLYPGERWVKFRSEYLESTGQYNDEENIFSGESYVHDVLCSEIDCAIDQLHPTQQKKFFGYDHQKPITDCPNCYGLRSSDSDRSWDFCQRRGRGKIECIACLSTFTTAEFIHRLQETYKDDHCKKIADALGLKFQPNTADCKT